MEIKIVVDLSDRTITLVKQLITGLNVGSKTESPKKMEAKSEEPKKVESKKVESKKVEPKVEETTEAPKTEAKVISDADLRAKVAEGSAAGLKDNIKRFLKEHYNTIKLADLKEEDYIAVYNAVDEMLKDLNADDEKLPF